MKPLNFKEGRLCACCSSPAMSYSGTPYCARHRPAVGRIPDYGDVRIARMMMKDGVSLKQVAEVVGLFSADLDLALWRAMGKDDDRPHRYAPDFEGAG